MKQLPQPAAPLASLPEWHEVADDLTYNFETEWQASRDGRGRLETFYDRVRARFGTPQPDPRVDRVLAAARAWRIRHSGTALSQKDAVDAEMVEAVDALGVRSV